NNEGEQWKGDADGFVREAIEGFCRRQKTFQVGTPPQQEQIEQRTEDAADQSGKNKGTRRQAGGEQPLCIERGISTVARTQDKYQQRDDLQQNTDEDRPVGQPEQAFVFLECTCQIEKKRSGDDQQHQEHQPAEVWNDDEEPDASLQEHFRLLLGIPRHHAEAAPIIEACQNSGVGSNGEQACCGEEG